MSGWGGTAGLDVPFLRSVNLGGASARAFAHGVFDSVSTFTDVFEVHTYAPTPPFECRLHCCRWAQRVRRQLPGRDAVRAYPCLGDRFEHPELRRNNVGWAVTELRDCRPARDQYPPSPTSILSPGSYYAYMYAGCVGTYSATDGTASVDWTGDVSLTFAAPVTLAPGVDQTNPILPDPPPPDGAWRYIL